MKTTDSNSGLERWHDLIRRARTDAPPPVDTGALLRALRSVTVEPPPTLVWMGEFAAIFSARRAVAACIASASLFALFGGWQAWTLWQALPWAQLLAVTTGGAP